MRKSEIRSFNISREVQTSAHLFAASLGGASHQRILKYRSTCRPIRRS